jgi:hypothetical protein
LVGAAAWHKRDNYVEEGILQEERTLMMSHRMARWTFPHDQHAFLFD